MSEQQQVEEWLKKIDEAEKFYADYYDLIDETREFYKDSKNKYSNKYNIFWSSVETLKPFLYFKQPKFYVERQNESNDPVEKLACRMLEKALEWDLSQFDFDSVIKYARNDFLISGMGVVWELYKPQLTSVPDPENPEKELQIKADEYVESVYLDPRYFLADVNQVGVWEEITWVGRKIYLTREQTAEAFGDDKAALMNLDGDDEENRKEICIYEIWDKVSKKVYWLSRMLPDKFLKVSDNQLKVQGFFPCPKPIFATLTNDSVIPVPDYCLIKEMLNELNGINSRMRLTMQALKVSGAYDNAFPELADILSKDVTLVSVSDFAKLRECGGIRGIVDFAPIEQYVAALEQLSLRRQEVINNIYSVTGVSDIMRGNSDSQETATAVVKKTNFGALRNQDRQNDMQRFIRDLLRIKAEIICEHFAPEKLASFLLPQEKANEQAVLQAINLLKTEKLRGMVFTVETDAVFNREEESASVLSAVNTINEMIGVAMSTVSQQPLLLPLYKAMIEAVANTLPKARVFEGVLEQVFAAVSQEFNDPQQDQQMQQQALMQQQMQQQQMQQQQQILQMQQQYSSAMVTVEMQKNELKARELEMKEKLEQQRLELDKREMEADIRLKEQQIKLKKATGGTERR